MIENKKLVASGTYQDVISVNDSYFIQSKKHKVAVIPYTVSGNMLDKIGVVRDLNYVTEKIGYTLINGYISEDDSTDMSAANRLLFNVIKRNVDDAKLWMYLGGIYNSLTSDSPIKLYACDISDIEIVENEELKDVKFVVLDSQKVVTGDDSLMLSSYFRLMEFFYIKGTHKNS